jgi:hypothetical protein
MPEERAPDRVVADIARRQHDAISIQQLHAAGLSDDAVLDRRRTGRLHRLHRGIYAVGHVAPSNERQWMAAVLAMGETRSSATAARRPCGSYCRQAPAPLTYRLPAGTGGNGDRGCAFIARSRCTQPK